MSGEVKQRYMQGDYLNVGTAGTPEWSLMGAGFTDLKESPSAQTSGKRYVNDKSETKRITGYDWSTSFTTDQIVSEPAIAYILNIGKKQLVGSDAETEYVVVDLNEAAVSAGVYPARKFCVAVEVSDFENNDGEMAASGNLLGIGDLTEGTFDVENKAFTASTP